MDEATRQSLSRQITGLGEPRQQGDEEFAATLQRLGEFLQERRRMPDRGAEDPEESRLGSWLRTQQAAERQGVLSGARGGSKLRGLIGPGWSGMR